MKACRTRSFALLIGAGLAFLFLSPLDAGAAEAAHDELETRLLDGPGLSDVVRRAFASNPGIRAARLASAAETQRTRVETGYPDPALTLTWNTRGTSDYDAKKWSVMLSQAIPFPGKLGAVAQLRRGAEESARIEYERVVRDALLQVRESYEELLYIAEARRIAEATLELTGLVRRVGETAYARERVPLSDLLKAESQEGQLRYDALLLEELERSEKARLNALLDRPVDAAIGRLAALPRQHLLFSREEIVRLAEVGREEVRSAGSGLRQALAARQIAVAENRPELMLGLGYESEASVFEGEPRMNSFTLQAGLSLPLWPGKVAGRRAAAREDAARAEAVVQEERNEASAAVQEAYFRHASATRLVELYGRDLIPQAARAMETAESWYREGGGSYAAYVEASIVWYNFQLASARAHADQGKYLARLEALAGRTLTDRADTAPGAPEDPPLYRALARAIPPSGIPGPAGAAEPALKEERAGLAAALEAAEREIAPDPADAFLVPDPSHLDRLAAAGRDAGAAGALLAGEYALADLEVLALMRSPRIRSAEEELRAAAEAYSQVENVDDILRRYGAYTAAVETGGGGMTTASDPERAFPGPGILSLKGAVVGAAVRAARESLEMARRDAVTEARRIFWEDAYLIAVAESEARTENVLSSLAETARTKYESGRGLLQEALRARIEVQKTRSDIVTLAEERRALQARLLALLDLPETTAVGTPAAAGVAIPSLPAASRLIPLAIERRQELRRLRAQAERMQRMIELGEKELLPDYSQGLSFFRNRAVATVGTAAMGTAFPSGGSGSGAPSAPERPWYGGEAAYLRETRAALAAAKSGIRATEQETVARVKAAWFAADRARREEALYRERIGEYARLAAQAADPGYRAGTLPFSDTIEAVRTRYEVEREAARRRSDLGIAVAELQALVGTSRLPSGEEPGAGVPSPALAPRKP